MLKNLAIWMYFSSKFGEFGPFFFHEKSFVQVEKNSAKIWL